MLGVSDKLYSLLANELLSASYFVYPVNASIYEHTIIIDLEFSRQISTMLLGDFSSDWVWHTQTVTDDHLFLMALGTYVWSGVMSVEERVQQIIRVSGYSWHRGRESYNAVVRILICNKATDKDLVFLMDVVYVPSHQIYSFTSRNATNTDVSPM